MYLPVPLFGYLCDRYSPSPLAMFSGLVFGVGYLLAAFTYKSGPPADAGGSGQPFWVMIVAFIAIGMGTSCMYLAAIATCAKNFGRGKHKGIMLAVPIAAFGLSGMWQSQLGTYLFYEPLEDGSHGDLDVYKYFVFLAVLLLVIGIIGTFALRIVDDDDKYIDETVEELERSGLLEESDFFRPQAIEYGTFSDSSDEEQSILSDEEREQQRLEKEREEEERRKRNWLLNYETRVFLQDKTMWWLAAGFFLVTGPGESYINNVSSSPISLQPITNLLTKIAGHNHPNPHTSILSHRRITPSRIPLNPRHNHSPDLDHRAPSNRLTFRLLRTPGNTPLSFDFRRSPIRAPHIPCILAPHSIPHDLPRPLSLPPLPRLPPPRLPSPISAPRHLQPDNRADRLRIRQRLFPRAYHHLCRLGRRELRHKLGYRCHDACGWCRALGHYLLRGISKCHGSRRR